MKKYILRSEYDCLVKSETEEFLLDVNSQIVFEKPEKVLIYPLKTNKYCYPFSIDLENKLDSTLFSCHLFEDFVLIYISNPPYIKNEFIETIKLNKLECKVFISQETVSFQTENIKKTFNLDSNFETYSIITFDNLIMIKLVGEIEQLWIFNINNLSLKKLAGNKIEIVNHEIFVNKSIISINQHQLYEVYEIKENEIIKKSENIKSNLFDSKLRNPRVIPYAFLEAIQLKDYNLARTFLTENLSQTATNQHLDNYFKEIKKILPLNNNLIATLTSSGLQVYNFTLDNNLVSEIDLKK